MDCTCARNARTSPANVDTASPRRSASAAAAAYRLSEASMRCHVAHAIPKSATIAHTVAMLRQC
ncbi:hypothetical protein [Streptomyces sp. NPDC059224]|uniref:hypothetical protein n=1 Tax=Streptomyces sp. NPDC059224 TaxID=3346775 RepID=UPI00368177DF